MLHFQTCLNPDAPSPGGDSTCGVKGPVTKIVGGVTAEKYKFTWLAMLGMRNHKNILGIIFDSSLFLLNVSELLLCGGIYTLRLGEILGDNNHIPHETLTLLPSIFSDSVQTLCLN